MNINMMNSNLQHIVEPFLKNAFFYWNYPTSTIRVDEQSSLSAWLWSKSVWHDMILLQNVSEPLTDYWRHQVVD